MLHSSPRAYGFSQTRWRLQDVRCALGWLTSYTEPGIYRVLKRLGFSRKQALSFVHSPDPAYRTKWQAILRAYREAFSQPEQVVLLFMDELTYHRRPSRARAYHRTGPTQPHACETAGPNTQTRVVAALNAVTGQVTYLQRSKIGAEALALFYARIRTAYPQAQKIYLVQDNWSVHQHDQVSQALQLQRLTPLFLPTYASWLNPIEKLWRWLKQTVLHLHRLASQLPELRRQVLAFLDQFQNGSLDLLRYVGILSE